MINESMIERLLTVRKLKSISKAADEMHVSRSSLVQQIKQKEEELGFAIFDRHSYGTGMTAAGEKFLDEMQRMRGSYDVLLTACREIDKKGEEEIVIGSLPNFKSAHLQRSCREFLAEHPNTKIKFRDFPLSEYTRRFHNREFDICAEYMMDYYMDEQSIAFKKIAETNYICGFAPGHRLYGAKKLSLSDLRGESVILYNKGISRTADRLRLFISREAPDVQLIGIDAYDSNLYNRCAMENAGLFSFAGYENSFPELRYTSLNTDFRVELGVGCHPRCREIVQQFVDSLSGKIKQY